MPEVGMKMNLENFSIAVLDFIMGKMSKFPAGKIQENASLDKFADPNLPSRRKGK